MSKRHGVNKFLTKANDFINRRVRYTTKEKEILEDHFSQNTHPSEYIKKKLAKKLGRTTRQIQVWFQNRRQRGKKKTKKEKKKLALSQQQRHNQQKKKTPPQNLFPAQPQQLAATPQPLYVFYPISFVPIPISAKHFPTASHVDMMGGMAMPTPMPTSGAIRSRRRYQRPNSPPSPSDDQFSFHNDFECDFENLDDFEPDIDFLNDEEDLNNLFL